jgi:hypothetical protein
MALVNLKHMPVVVPVALAVFGGSGQADTFQGTCQFSGKLRQQPPLTGTPRAGRATARARGLCDGVRATYFARAAGTVSCAGGSATGKGFIRIRRDRIGFRFSEIRGPGTAAVRLEGADGGSAAGAARVSENEDPAEIAQKCGGDGLRAVRIHIDLATTPSISG